jgi:Kef-type K+ transport system membrane component KefB
MRINRTPLGQIIIGAAIADDIFALISLSVLLGLAKTGTVKFADVWFIVVKVCAFFGLTILLGHYVVPKFTRKSSTIGKARLSPSPLRQRSSWPTWLSIQVYT